MPGIKFVARVLKGASFEKFNYIMGIVKQKSGQSKFRTFFDVLWCAARYGAGYFDYALFGFYAMNGKQRDTYVTRVRNKKIIDRMNRPEYFDEFNDKLKFISHFAPYLRRKLLNAEHASFEEFLEFLDGLDSFFAKPVRGKGGCGIEKLRPSDYPDKKVLWEHLRSKQLYLLEETLEQHPEMAKLHPESVNTLRIVTDRVDEKVYIAYVLLKIGRGNNFCDNTGQEGMFCRVDEHTGKICSIAVDDYFNDYEVHPDTGIRFQGYQLPMFRETLEFVKNAAMVVPEIGHIGWDVAIAKDGPAIIEGNADPGVMCQFAPHYPEKQGLWPYYRRILKL